MTLMQHQAAVNSSPINRCPDCGAKVYLPCQACSIKGKHAAAEPPIQTAAPINSVRPVTPADVGFVEPVQPISSDDRWTLAPSEIAKLDREQTESPNSADKVIPPHKVPTNAKRARTVIRPLATSGQVEPAAADHSEVSVGDLCFTKRRLRGIRRSLDFILNFWICEHARGLAHQLKKSLVPAAK